MPVLSQIKRLIVGAPIATSRAHFERLGVFFGLALLASDNISSVAYASEEILVMLSRAGEAALSYGLYIGIAIVLLVLIVLFSYSRTIINYPQGGGDYRVASDNLNSFFGRVAGAALLLDYTLTVAVSVSAGVLAIVSAFPAIQPYTVQLGLSAILLLTIVNLRGTRESGIVFAIPIYSFVFLMFSLIILGFFKLGAGIVEGGPTIAYRREHFEALSFWLLLRAFAAGCAALTGIEALANGTMIFKPPEAKNALKALAWLGVIMTIMFTGVTWLATHFPIRIMTADQEGYKTVVAQLAELTFGPGSATFFAVQFATMAILILAANTAYADFPRLCSFIARDSYLPRQLANLGDRLVYQNGIIILALLAGGLIVFAKGDTHRLIPLYALGVFTAFTLGQAGMTLRQLKNKMLLGAFISAIGMTATGVVWFVILITKFVDGAWMVVIALSVLLLTFWAVKRHYISLARQLQPTENDVVPKLKTSVILLVPPIIHRGILNAIAYARTLSKDCRAVHIAPNLEMAEKLKQEWDKYAPDIPLVILESPYRSLVEPLVEYIDEAVGEERNHMLTVIVPQAVPAKWYHAILHNNSAIPIKLALAGRRNVVVTNVKYFLDE
ncbi:MAG TPA: APC family permease [Fimbriimonadales bacterium]|nr:APC family permease [Fimbriimonadales bacterium]